MSKLLSALREVFRAIAFRDFTFERCSSAWRFGADHRAERLLVAALSPMQLAQYRKAGHFEVVGCHTGSRYRILRSPQMNIERLDRRGWRVELLCFVPETQLPLGDVMLAQKLALELYEIDALNAANRFPVRSKARRHWSGDFPA